jgi:hypothetical protein
MEEFKVIDRDSPLNRFIKQTRAGSESIDNRGVTVTNVRTDKPIAQKAENRQSMHGKVEQVDILSNQQRSVQDSTSSFNQNGYTPSISTQKLESGEDSDLLEQRATVNEAQLNFNISEREKKIKMLLQANRDLITKWHTLSEEENALKQALVGKRFMINIWDLIKKESNVTVKASGGSQKVEKSDMDNVVEKRRPKILTSLVRSNSSRTSVKSDVGLSRETQLKDITLKIAASIESLSAISPFDSTPGSPVEDESSLSHGLYSQNQAKEEPRQNNDAIVVAPKPVSVYQNQKVRGASPRGSDRGLITEVITEDNESPENSFKAIPSPLVSAYNVNSTRRTFDFSRFADNASESSTRKSWNSGGEKSRTSAQILSHKDLQRASTAESFTVSLIEKYADEAITSSEASDSYILTKETTGLTQESSAAVSRDARNEKRDEPSNIKESIAENTDGERIKSRMSAYVKQERQESETRPVQRSNSARAASGPVLKVEIAPKPTLVRNSSVSSTGLKSNAAVSPIKSSSQNLQHHTSERQSHVFNSERSTRTYSASFASYSVGSKPQLGEGDSTNSLTHVNTSNPKLSRALQDLENQKIVSRLAARFESVTEKPKKTAISDRGSMASIHTQVSNSSSIQVTGGNPDPNGSSEALNGSSFYNYGTNNDRFRTSVTSKDSSSSSQTREIFSSGASVPRPTSSSQGPNTSKPRSSTVSMPKPVILSHNSSYVVPVSKNRKGSAERQTQ